MNSVVCLWKKCFNDFWLHVKRSDCIGCFCNHQDKESFQKISPKLIKSQKMNEIGYELLKIGEIILCIFDDLWIIFLFTFSKSSLYFSKMLYILFQTISCFFKNLLVFSKPWLYFFKNLCVHSHNVEFIVLISCKYVIFQKLAWTFSNLFYMEKFKWNLFSRWNSNETSLAWLRLQRNFCLAW